MLQKRLFLVSYAPLFLMLAIRDWPTNDPLLLKWTSWALLLGLAVIGFADGIILVQGSTRSGTLPLRVANISDEGSSAAGYLATYLLPFIAIDFDSIKTIASYLLYFLVLYIVATRSSIGLVNPTMYLLGWRIFAAETITVPGGGASARVTILAKKPPPSGIIHVTKMAGGYRLKEGDI